MNKIYQVVFNKARGGLTVVQEGKTSQHKKAKLTVACCLALSLLATTAGVNAADAFSVKPKTENGTKVDNVIDANGTYTANYADGISGVTRAFCAVGWVPTKTYPTPATATISLTTENITVEKSQQAVYAKDNGKIILGNESTRRINLETTGTTVAAEKLSTVELTANTINLSSSQDNESISVKIQSDANDTAYLSQVDITSAQDLTLSAKSQESGASNLKLSGKKAVANLKAENIVLSSDTQSTKANSFAAGINGAGNNQVSLVAESITFTQNAKNLSYGIKTQSTTESDSATVTLGDSNTKAIHFQSRASDGNAYGIFADAKTSRDASGLIKLSGENISFNVQAKKQASGIEMWNGNSAVIGTDKSVVNLNVASNEGEAFGVSAQLGSVVDIQGTNLNITLDGSKTVGVHAQNNTTDASDGFATVNINSQKTTIKADTALSAMSQGRIYVNGDLEVDAKTAILARGNSVIDINKEGTHTVKLVGDVDFNYDQVTSGTTTDATVNINLTGQNSSWMGNAKTSADSGTPSADLRQSHLSLSLNDGASWTPTAIDTSVNDNQPTAVHSLKLSNGVINLTNDGAKKVNITSLSGSGTVNVDVNASNGELVTQHQLIVGETAQGAKLNVVAQNITSDDVADPQNALNSLASVIDGEIASSQTIQEGAVRGSITQTKDAAGNTISVTTAENSKLSAFKAVSSTATMMWRQDMNDLTKRMGELRDSPANLGSWARLYGSELEYGKQNLKTKSTSIQVGSDYDVGSGWKVGGAFSYTDGSSTYANGDADLKSYGFAAYGSWLGASGNFLDLIAKYSRLENDFSLSTMSGSSDNNAYSVSAEVGHHFIFAEHAFLEPQLELTYGRIVGDSLTTSNGVKIDQEDTESLIGRAGIRGGFHFPNHKGTIYARASVLHDWKGESESTASIGMAKATTKDNIGGTYYELGVGANFNWTPNAYSYVDLERQNGGDVKENWRWNVGFRYVW